MGLKRFTIHDIGEDSNNNHEPKDFVSDNEPLIFSLMPIVVLIFIPGAVIGYTYRFEHKKKSKK